MRGFPGQSCTAGAARLSNVCSSIYSARCRAGDSCCTLSLVEFNLGGLKAGRLQNEGKTKPGGKETRMAGVGSPGAVRVLPVRAPALVVAVAPVRPWWSLALGTLGSPSPLLLAGTAAAFAALPEISLDTASRATP